MDMIKEFTGQQNILTIPRVFIDYLDGDLPAALFLSQVLYWSSKKDDGWFYKSYAEWQEELTLTEYMVRKARNLLEKKDILRTKRRKVKGAPVLWYQIKSPEFSDSILKFLKVPTLKVSRKEGKETSGSLTPEIPPKITAETIYPPVFLEFWTLYPRKIEKKGAFAKWKATLRKGAKLGELIMAARGYRDQVERDGTEEKYIKHPATFLGPAEPWREYYEKELAREKAEAESTVTAEFDWKKYHEERAEEEQAARDLKRGTA